MYIRLLLGRKPPAGNGNILLPEGEGWEGEGAKRGCERVPLIVMVMVVVVVAVVVVVVVVVVVEQGWRSGIRRIRRWFSIHRRSRLESRRSGHTRTLAASWRELHLRFHLTSRFSNRLRARDVDVKDDDVSLRSTTSPCVVNGT